MTSLRHFAAVAAFGVIGLAASTLPQTAAAQSEAPALGAVSEGSIPDEVRAVVLAAQPTMTIAEAELKEREARRYYDVEGTLPDGSEIELDLLETPTGWKVVEIQRDLPWTAVPADVAAATSAAQSGFTPVRVIESQQAEDGSVIYELFADGHPGEPAIEVRVKDGKTEVLKEASLH